MLAIGGGRRRCGGDFLMTIGHVTFGVLPLPLFSFHSFALAQSYGSIFSLSASVSPPMLHLVGFELWAICPPDFLS